MKKAALLIIGTICALIALATMGYVTYMDYTIAMTSWERTKEFWPLTLATFFFGVIGWWSIVVGLEQ